ncbi:MAG TPA: helix-hairpin-helix domain-containing protein [Candidatus Angelobacter sp.]|jgi:DNA uptake protein ComE-like DNA-binding protein
MRLILVIALSTPFLFVSGCGQRDAEKTKQQAAQATEKVKEESKTAAVELKKDAKEAAKQTKAAAEGVQEGIQSPDAAVNVNTASKAQLQTLPGLDEEMADRIIAGRPYHTVDEVGTKGVVPPEEFQAIKRKIVVK